MSTAIPSTIEPPTALQEAILELQRELTDYRATASLQYEAQMRGIKRWQQAVPGRELTWPDSAHLVEWLLERMSTLESLLAESLKHSRHQLQSLRQLDLKWSPQWLDSVKALERTVEQAEKALGTKGAEP